MIFSTLTLLTTLVALGTALGWAARAHWSCELAAHFRLQYASVAAGCAAAFLVGGQWGPMCGAAGLALVNLRGVGRLYRRHVSAASSELSPVRLLVANIDYRNRRVEPLLRLVEHEQPDLLVLIELTPWWVEVLQRRLQPRYPHARHVGLRSGFGIGCFSRVPVEQMDLVEFGDTKLPSLVARLRVGAEPVTLIGTHPYAPVTRRKARLRNQQLQAIAQAVRAQEGSFIVVGDLNITTWSPYFHDFLQMAGLRDTQEGFGAQWTWPTRFPLVGISIDHCLVSPNVVVVDRRVGPPIGSDHRPILMDLTAEPLLVPSTS